MRRHFTVVLAGDGIGSLFGTFVKHAGSFDQFLSMGHGGTSVRVHMPLCMVKTLFPQVGHGYLILAIDHRHDTAVASSGWLTTSIEAREHGPGI